MNTLQYLKQLRSIVQKAAIILIDQKKNDEALEIFKNIKSKYLNSSAQQDVDKYIEYLSDKK